MGDLSRCKLHECVGCGHLYQVMVTACDCMNNPENIYREWTAIPSGEFNKLMSAPGGDAVESERAANAQLTAELEALRQERDGLLKRDINAIANRICGEIPDGFYIELILENGSGWVSLMHKDEQVDIDMSDWSIAEQFNVAMQCVDELEKEQVDGN